MPRTKLGKRWTDVKPTLKRTLLKLKDKPLKDAQLKTTFDGFKAGLIFTERGAAEQRRRCRRARETAVLICDKAQFELFALCMEGLSLAELYALDTETGFSEISAWWLAQVESGELPPSLFSVAEGCKRIMERTPIDLPIKFCKLTLFSLVSRTPESCQWILATSTGNISATTLFPPADEGESMIFEGNSTANDAEINASRTRNLNFPIAAGNMAINRYEYPQTVIAGQYFPGFDFLQDSESYGFMNIRKSVLLEVLARLPDEIEVIHPFARKQPFAMVPLEYEDLCRF